MELSKEKMEAIHALFKKSHFHSNRQVQLLETRAQLQKDDAILRVATPGSTSSFTIPDYLQSEFKLVALQRVQEELERNNNDFNSLYHESNT